MVVGTVLYNCFVIVFSIRVDRDHRDCVCHRVCAAVCCGLTGQMCGTSVCVADGVVCCVWWEPVCQYLQETVLSAACGGSQRVGI